MRFKPGASYAIVAVLALGIVVAKGEGTDGNHHATAGLAVGTGGGEAFVGPRHPDAGSHELAGASAGTGDATLDGWSASEPDAVLGVPGVPGDVAGGGSPGGADSSVGQPEIRGTVPPETPIAAASLGLSTPPNVEMWRAEVERYQWVVYEAMAILNCESQGNPLARGDNGVSKGLFQVNSGWEGPYGPHGWASWYGIEPEQLFDGPTNIAVAYAIREHRGRWGGPGGWTCADKLGIW